MYFILTIFISAFLLFQVQPIIAKIILPLFGGGAAIWTSCMLFFQGFLLLGYLYAHGLSQLKNIKHQLAIHGVLLLISLAFLPGSVTLGDTITNTAEPLSAILSLLFFTVGFPYLMLSATGPLVQRWLSLAKQQAIPYKLYSVSNIGSLLALVSYPFVIEPWISLPQQTMIWSCVYALLVVLFLVLITSLYKNHLTISSVKQEQEHTSERYSFITKGLWLLLSCIGVVLLVSTTNAMTQNVPPMPFLWLLPLSLYLLTFIICFHSPRWYVRWYWLAVFILSAFVAMLMNFIGSQFDLISQVLMYSFILFSACMICHGELVKLKPNAYKLTQFYLLMSLGGFLGSVLVSIVAERVFVQFTEFPIAIIATLVLFMVCIYLDRQNVKPPLMAVQGGLAVTLLTLVGLFTLLDSQFNQHNVANSRNFYGLLKVVDVEVDDKQERRLIDGSTSHGTQLLDNALAQIPQSYYRQDTGIGLTLTHFNSTAGRSLLQPLNVGVVGLGTGTLAAYGKPLDNYRFFEINPDVEKMANTYFSYMEKSAAKITTTIGDGRQLLKNELNTTGSLNFDVLVIDAFSGDAIPIHLLTQQAFTLYWQHLNESGVLALHISNSHLDLKALTNSLAKQLGKPAYYFKTNASEFDSNDAEWVLITNNQLLMNHYALKNKITPWPQQAHQELLWTDSYSNLLSVIK